MAYIIFIGRRNIIPFYISNPDLIYLNRSKQILMVMEKNFPGSWCYKTFLDKISKI